MKKVVLGIILGIIVISLSLFGWRVYHYYSLIKTGGAVHFSQGQGLSAGQAGLPATSAGSSASLLRSGAPASPARLGGPALPDASLGGPELGNPAASLTIVEFADFTCSYSRQAFSVMRELLAKYPEKIRFIFRVFPLEGTGHQGSQEAALAALCADEQGKFWAYHDKLFLNQKNFTAEDLKNYARQVGLDEAKFSACLESRKYQTIVQADYRDGLAAGVVGTPTFFVNGQKVEGAAPMEEWEKIVK